MDYITILDSLGNPRSFDDKMKEGASLECGLAGSMPLRDFPMLGRKIVHPTRSPDAYKNDSEY